jgi:hypothetical protein
MSTVHHGFRVLVTMISLTLPIRSASAQDSCVADSARAALADSLVPTAAEVFDQYPLPRSGSIFADLRAAVDATPLSRERWAKILQWARFLGAADSAIAWAALALQRWPQCTLGDTALAQAIDLARPKRRP